jgi:ubiquinone/menaquinone biosynthesis C-methylase UbiE
MPRDLSLRTTFNRVAKLYDEMRPGYPEALIGDVLSLSGIPPDGRILEIGCGAGQATLPLARRGYAMLCLDIGKDLISITARKCRPYPKVEFRLAAFEDWAPEGAPFDLAVSASAFHWVPPEIGYPKVARVLKKTGAFAILRNHHPTPYTGFHLAAQEVYRRCAPELAKENANKSHEDGIRSTVAQFDATGLFGPVTVRRYPWSRQFNSEEYLKLLETYSNHHNLPEGKKKALYQGIKEMIERHGGVITRPYLSVMYLAHRA